MEKLSQLNERLMSAVQNWKYRARVFALKNLFFFAPLKNNKIVFINFNGRGYGCNPKYIAQEILAQNLNLDLVWLVNDLNEPVPEGIRKVIFQSTRGLYEVATARVVVTNVKNDLCLVKKKKQYIIQTWHGSYSAKLLEREAAGTLSEQYLKESRKNSKQTDLFLSNSRVLSECYQNAFWCDCEILECGFPRNDVLFHQSDEQKRMIRARLGVPEQAKLVMYAPTFRDDGSVDCYNIDCRGILHALPGTEEWFLLIRLHPNVGDASNLFAFDDHILDATPYPDMQELLVVSDVLITDYSSTVFEFAALEKPSVIYAPDVDAYHKMRGLKDDFYRMPYPVCRTNQELMEQLAKLTPEYGKEKAAQFMTFFGGVDKGDASEQVVERICCVLNEGNGCGSK